MGRVGYDPFEGLYRLLGAVDGIDPRAATILACHLALEREVVIVLNKLLPYPDRLRNLGFVQKVQVLNAAWQGDEEAGDRICAALNRFNDLRNAVGHGNDDRVDGCLQSLRTAYKEIYPESSGAISIEDIAGGIVAYFGDGPTPEEIRTVVTGMAEVMKGVSGTLANLSAALNNPPDVISRRAAEKLQARSAAPATLLATADATSLRE
ncbi:hypothetical protein RZN05_05100 [Sphingomonas sp. HF-S4]|uniref:RiboL-PSP-HEPN domain-containing protein n=1 Tax=Sphingomonas agrestis TaxID=3080540 RepID=A0ABU3Y4M9_9SPHN|nr:hypothetical protein [Sphingomonas sp. HF-S4]MDV3456351.1 hypothetical protein [Sphingomonas sp. HF-S4]